MRSTGPPLFDFCPVRRRFGLCCQQQALHFAARSLALETQTLSYFATACISCTLLGVSQGIWQFRPLYSLHDYTIHLGKSFER